MNLAAIASTIVYVAGTVLFGVLAGLALKRKQKSWSDTILLLLGISAATWYFGNAVDRFGYLLREGSLPIVVKLTDVICCLGIALIPSLLMIMALLYLHERRRRLPRVLLIALVASICALALPFSLMLVKVISGEARLASLNASPAGKAFLAWLALSLIASAAVCFVQTRRMVGQPERRFFLILFWCIVLLAGSIVAFPFLARGGRLGSEVDLLFSLGGLFPGILFAYYVYRYNYLEYVLRRTFFHAFLTLLVICIYYFLIRQLALWLGLRVPGLNVALVEAVLVIGLVYLFPRMGGVLREVLRSFFFRRTADTESMISELNREISSDAMLDFAGLLHYACKGINQASGARTACIILEDESGLAFHGDRPDGGFGENDFRAIISVCDELGPAWLERHEVKNVPCLAAMRKLRVRSVYPIVHEGTYRGFIAVGRTPSMLPPAEEVSEQLVVMANRISSAMGRAKMIREKMELQRRLYAKEKFTSLGQLAASVAHEVRNPLSSIKSLVQCMEEELAEKGIRPDETGLIVDEINRLNRTVSGLLRYARPSDDVRQEADFREVLETVLRILRHELERRGCGLELDVPERLRPVRAGDDEVKEIVFNLIFNALEAMPGGGTLTIAAHQGSDRLRVRVVDTGPGIPEDMQEKVFEPSFTTKEGGSGLGLSIVRERLLQIGGSVRCSSSQRGTTMEIEFPLAAEPAGIGRADQSS